jgi:uncharacterized membrane protein YkvA (DUF1232 family)
MGWTVAVSVVVALLTCWVAFLITLAAIRPKGALLREAIRILPDLLRLLHRLAADSAVPRGVRIRVGLLLAYLAIPIDLIPDFIPVLGYADDAVVVTAVLRSVVRRAGLPAVQAHCREPPTG